jgi:RecA-family ATPase
MTKQQEQKLDLEDGMTLAIEAPTKVNYLIDGRLTEEGLSILVGKPKLGKTSFALDAAVAVAEGRDFLGWPTKCGDVIYLYLEGPKDLPGRRLRQLGYTGTRGQIRVFRKTMPRKFEDGLALLMDALKTYPNTKLIVVDTLAKLVRLKDSDKYDESVAAMEWLEKFSQKFHLHVLCLAHAKKYISDDAGDSLLGSTAFRGSSDTNLFLTKQGNRRVLSTEQRVGDSLESTYLDLDKESQLLSLGPTVESAEEDRRDFKKKATRERIESEVRDALIKSPGATTRELLHSVTGNYATITDVIATMEKIGAIESKQEGKAEKHYLAEIPEEPRKAA